MRNTNKVLLYPQWILKNSLVKKKLQPLNLVQARKIDQNFGQEIGSFNSKKKRFFPYIGGLGGFSPIPLYSLATNIESGSGIRFRFEPLVLANKLYRKCLLQNYFLSCRTCFFRVFEVVVSKTGT